MGRVDGEVPKSCRHNTTNVFVRAAAVSHHTHSIGDLASPSSNLRCVQSGRASPAKWSTRTEAPLVTALTTQN